MAVNLSQPQEIKPVDGTCVRVLEAGLRYHGRADMALIELAEGTITSAVFTKNKFAAAPVQVAKLHLGAASPRYLLINAGNANAGTGQQGFNDAAATCDWVADKVSVERNRVLPFSTGVIGELFDRPLYRSAIEQVVAAPNSDWRAAADAIMTTDTVAKAISETVEIDGKSITITGIAKGSGMISPNMATMLAFIATDVLIDKEVLDLLVKRAVDQSFNRITVDSDTSTNDAVTVSATGCAQNAPIDSADSTAAKAFYKALESVMLHLAHSIIRDGEGATKFITVSVINGATSQDCREIAFKVANSPLVKTAMYASDPNWGRLLMAIGKAEDAFIDPSVLSLSVNGVDLLQGGLPASNYTESQGKAAFEQDEIVVTIDLAVGDSSFRVWTSDLSHDYVSINADYRS